MIRPSAFLLIGTTAAFFCAANLPADTYPVILHGKVTMPDGTPPPFSVSIERQCSDSQNGTPGPLINKKGEWIWRLEIDAFAERSCRFRAIHPGYTSTEIDASNINTISHNTEATLPTIIMSPTVADPSVIRFTDDDIPGKAKGNINAAMKAMDNHNYDESRHQIELAVAAAPKFAAGWSALGIIDDNLQMEKPSREAFEHAVAADPKYLPAYVMLERICVKTKDWDCVLKAADGAIKADKKNVYPESYLHRAVAQYQTKDLDGAQTSVKEAIRLDTAHHRPRAEYVEGRILEAKGDAAGAKEHMTKYLQADPNAPDADAIKKQIESIGQTPAGDEPELERL